MTHYETLKSESMGSYGVVTSRKAARLGIRGFELDRWTKVGKLIKTARGVYRFADYPMDSESAAMTAILAEVGEGAYLCGETALGFMELCPVRSYVATVATPNRFRRHVSEGIQVYKGAAGYEPSYYNGVPCQRAADAIRAAVIDGDKREEAIFAARKAGLISDAEQAQLNKEFGNG